MEAIDFYPFEYGSYKTHYFGDSQLSTLNTWFINNLQLNSLNVLSDGDLIVQIGIAKGEYLIYSNDSSIYFKSFIARINKETGQIIWAYAYFFNEFENQQIPYSLKVINDTIWTIGYFENSGSYPVGTAKVEIWYNNSRYFSNYNKINCLLK